MDHIARQRYLEKARDIMGIARDMEFDFATDPTQVDWDAYRREVAKEVAAAMWSDIPMRESRTGKIQYTEMADMAVDMANALIERLKKEGKK